MGEVTEDDNQEWRRMVEDGWKSAGQKVVRKRSSGHKKAVFSQHAEQETVEKPAAQETSMKPSAQPLESSGSVVGRLGSWSRLLSRGPVLDAVSAADVEAPALSSESALEAEGEEASLPGTAEPDVGITTKDSDVVESLLDVEVLEVLDAGEDEDDAEGVDAEGVREVQESDTAADEEWEMGEADVAEAEACELNDDAQAAEDALIDSAISDVIEIDDDDEDDNNAVGAEFRQSLKDLPDVAKPPTLMKTKTVPKAMQARPPAGPPPKQLQVPKAPGPAAPKQPPAASGATVSLVRSLSSKLRVSCAGGHDLRKDPMPTNSCNVCGKIGTVWRCVADCDFDLCTWCYNDKCSGQASCVHQGARQQSAGSNMGPNVPLQQRAGKRQPIQAGSKGQAAIPKAGGGVGLRSGTSSGSCSKTIVRPSTFVKPGEVVAGLKRASSWQQGFQQPRPPGTTIVRANSWHNMPKESNPCKRPRTDTGPIAARDAEGRPYDLNTVVVNFANVGASYAKKVLKRSSGDQMLFDWEGVRRCVLYLTKKLGVKVIGVIFENFWATDNDSKDKREIPADITQICESIEETPRIVGRNHSSADDEMTIKCAYHRNCRFMDNDNYRDWKQQLRDEQCRAWLDKCQDLLHMRYYFDSSIGVFETLDGNVPPGLLAPNGEKIPASVSKRALWTLPNR